MTTLKDTMLFDVAIGDNARLSNPVMRETHDEVFLSLTPSEPMTHGSALAHYSTIADILHYPSIGDIIKINSKKVNAVEDIHELRVSLDVGGKYYDNLIMTYQLYTQAPITFKVDLTKGIPSNVTHTGK